MRKIAYALIAGVAMLLLWQGCYSYTISQAQDDQQRLLSVQLGELDRQLNQFSFIPKLLSDDLEVRQALLSRTQSAVQAANHRLQRTQTDSGLDVAYLLDTEGSTVASSNWAQSVSFVGINYSFRPYFQQAIQGKSATFFAVGVTSGLPGYFIAEPVMQDSKAIGVVVAKIALNVLVEAWSQLPYESLVSDEFGTVILSTNPELLYTATRELSEQQLAQLLRERRYTVRAALLEPVAAHPDRWQLTTSTGSSVYRLFSQSLTAEPWNLISLVSQQRVFMRAVATAAALTAGLLIGFLLLRLYQQQRMLVLSEKRNSQELEKQVSLRTRELERAQKRLISESNFLMLGRMSAAINHEINQPLASLRLNMASLRTLIAQQGTKPADIEQIVIDSDRTTKRIGRVISSLRSIARKNEARFQAVSVNRLVNDVYATIERERPKFSRYVSVTSRAADVQVLGDEVLIQQALLNLLYNAFDAVLTVECPEIELQISVESVDGDKTYRPSTSSRKVILSVIDNGAGIAESVKTSLFEPFATASQHSDGMGLGLTIARQIAADHDGQLVFSSRRTGSCFSLVLPEMEYAVLEAA